MVHKEPLRKQSPKASSRKPQNITHAENGNSPENAETPTLMTDTTQEIPAFPAATAEVATRIGIRKQDSVPGRDSGSGKTTKAQAKAHVFPSRSSAGTKTVGPKKGHASGAPEKIELASGEELTQLTDEPVKHFLTPRYVLDTVKNAQLSWSLSRRILVAALSLGLLINLGILWDWKNNVDANFKSVDALDLHSKSIRNMEGQLGDQTYLIVGTDSRSGSNSKLGAGSEADVEGARSDTVILVDVPANKQRVIAISFPRDLQVRRPDCKQWNNDEGTYSDDIVPGGDYTKLNAAYAVGGPKCLVSVIQDLSGLQVNHFVGLDFSGFEHLVNDIGGVEVCSPTRLVDGELGTIFSRPGRHILSGAAALKYVRARKVYTDGTGDYGRIKRQQHFLSSLLRSMISTKVLFNPSRLNKLISDFTKVTFVQNITTTNLLDLAQSIRNINAGHVTMLTIPTLGTSQDGQYNEIPNVDSMNTIFDAIIDDAPLPGEPGYHADETEQTHNPDNSENNSPPPQPRTSDYSFTVPSYSGTQVRILNASNISGLAQKMSNSLAAAGFSVIGTMDASTVATQTIVRYYNSPGDEDSSNKQKRTAAAIAAMIPNARIQESKIALNQIDILVGKDSETTLKESLPSVGTTLSVPELPPLLRPLPYDVSFTNAADDTCN